MPKRTRFRFLPIEDYAPLSLLPDRVDLIDLRDLHRVRIRRQCASADSLQPEPRPRRATSQWRFDDSPEIVKGSWHPEADDGMALAVYAFGETGQPLQNPGPIIRVPQGTEIHATLHNALDVPVTVHGLSDPALPADEGVPVAPGATQQVNFKATTPGLFFYWGASEQQDLKLRHGVDSELTGAFVVDPPGASADDEIFVIEMISEFAGISSRKTLATINGKSWPFTQRFQYELGHFAHWRWINATNEPHALHLHGFCFRVDA